MSVVGTLVHPAADFDNSLPGIVAGEEEFLRLAHGAYREGIGGAGAGRS